jgi:hypothetical protein
MPQDKTIIKVPSIAYTQVVPNIANNVSELLYNEGIYINRQSLSALYPKSVVRIYKNVNNPKKIYLLSKDTSLMDAISNATKSGTRSTENEIIANPSYQQYVSTDEEQLVKYSKFTQPSNITTLDFTNSSLNGKQVNFYVLSAESYVSLYQTLSGEVVRQVLEDSGEYRTLNGLLRNSDVPLNQLVNYDETTYSYLLKSKSIVTDFSENSSSAQSKLASVFNASLYAYWQESGSFSKLKPLTEYEISLYKTKNITSARAIDFSQYVDKKYDSIWTQKVDNEIAYAGPNSVNDSYVISAYDTYAESWFTFRYNPTFVTFPDSNSIEYLYGKNLFFLKQDSIIGESSNNRQLFKMFGDESTISFDRYYRSGDTTEVYGAFRQNTYEIFDSSYILDLTSSSTTDIYKYANSIRNTQISNLRNSDLSTIYVLKNTYDYTQFGFVPDNPEQVVYEIELDEELEIQNGAFAVVEIL